MSLTFLIGQGLTQALNDESHDRPVKREKKDLKVLQDNSAKAELVYVHKHDYDSGKALAETRREELSEFLMQHANILSGIIVSQYAGMFEFMKPNWLQRIAESFDALYLTEGDQRIKVGARAIRSYAREKEEQDSDWIAEFMAS